MERLTIEDKEPIKRSLEKRKRQVLVSAIDQELEIHAKIKGGDGGKGFALSTLEDIQLGNNPDLIGALRAKVEELGIPLDDSLFD